MPEVKFAANGGEVIGATVSYYYVMPHGKPDFSKVGGPVLGHFGTDDEFVSVEDARALEGQLREAGVDAAFQYYPGVLGPRGHSFHCNNLNTF